MSDIDPYSTPEELQEIGTPFFLRWTGKDGTFSTWRERHISIRAFCAGWKSGILAPVPDCPAIWADEGQYWDSLAMIGNVAKFACIVAILNTAAGAAILKLTGVI